MQPTPTSLPISHFTPLANTAMIAEGGNLQSHHQHAGALDATLSQRLRSAVDSEKLNATFACGGEFPNGATTVYFTDAKGQHNRIDFPPSADALQRLVEACEPAPFGYMGKDVLDPSYRQALKIEPSRFAVACHPYDLGFLDVVQQILLPGVVRREMDGRRHIAVELYKLNIYTTNGLFKSHVDTPRSYSQFGSLVICLPSAHAGGDLLIRHNDRVSTFSWASGAPTAIKWAAFYSDCTHEILPVASGHRITLTYNLYYSTGLLADTIPGPPLLDGRSLPLHQELAAILQQPAFLPRGGVLGFYCDHRYPHTDKTAAARLPATLKGVDAAILVALANLGIPVSTCPYYADVEDDSADKEDLDDDWSSDEANCIPEEHQLNPPLYVGKFTPMRIDYGGAEGTRETEIFRDNLDSFQKLRNTVHWINEPLQENSEVALAFMKYGNQAEMGVLYAQAVILATVPPYAPSRGWAKGKSPEAQQAADPMALD